MARSRACSTGWEFPIRTPAFAHRRLAMDKVGGESDLRVCRFAGRTRPTSCRPTNWKMPTRCRCLTWSSRSTKAPRSASRSSAWRQPPRRNRARMALRPRRAGGGVHPRPRTDSRVMGDRALAVTEILADAGAFYDYESKYADGGSRHIIPAHGASRHRTTGPGCRASRRTGRWAAAAPRAATSATTTPQASRAGWCCWRSIRSPGLTPTSLLPEQAAHLGMSFAQLCAWMVENATCRA